jgi:hypothetical protein
MAASMSPAILMRLADAVLLLHFAIILFNIFGLVVIPLGAWRGWAFVRIFWWRALHLGILAVVALQAVLERACFLTLWQADLLRQASTPASQAPLIQSWIGRLIFWPLPPWFFVALYLAVWIYTLVLWRMVPPRR